MDADERPLPWRPSPCQRLRRKVVHHGRRSNSLSEIATTIVALDEHPAGIPGPGRHSSVPYVRDEEGNVTCFGHDGSGAPAFPLKVIVSGLSMGGTCPDV